MRIYVFLNIRSHIPQFGLENCDYFEGWGETLKTQDNSGIKLQSRVII